MRKWWIGCSGFSYKHWKGRFYPDDVPQKRWFEYYCRFFNTVELNVTFYRLPTLEIFKGWYERSPQDFRFTVKAPRLITHYKRFNNSLKESANFYNIITKGLEDKLGSILFQLHPRFEYSEENFEKVLATLDTSYTNVLEFRHPSWWRQDVYCELKKENITFCGISYPSLPDDVIRTASAMYYRFHGDPQLYLSPYSLEKMKQVVDDIKAFRSVEDVYIYFNNDIEVSAIDNAKTIRQLVSRKNTPVVQKGRRTRPAVKRVSHR